MKGLCVGKIRNLLNNQILHDVCDGEFQPIAVAKLDKYSIDHLETQDAWWD